MKNALGCLCLMIFIVFGVNEVRAQPSKPNFSKEIGPARYSHVDGSPYLYEEWLDAEIIASSGKVYTQTKTNYNGYTQTIEYYEGAEVKELMTGSYLKVSFQTDAGVQAFIRGMHAEFGMDLICLLYDGENVEFVKKIVVSLEDYNTANGTVSRFIPRADYFLITNGRLNRLTLKKKKILEALKSNNSALEKYIEEKNLKLKTEGEIIELLNYYENGLK